MKQIFKDYELDIVCGRRSNSVKNLDIKLISNLNNKYSDLIIQPDKEEFKKLLVENKLRKIILGSQHIYIKRPKESIYYNFGRLTKWLNKEIKERTINSINSVSICSNKLLTFRALKGNCNIPKYTENIDVAMNWDTFAVGRSLLNSSKGKGIYFLKDDPTNFFKCKFFTKYIKKQAEYRIHVSLGKTFDVQQKKLKLTDINGEPIDKNRVDWRVRNSKNGFVFARNNIDVPDCILEQAEKACQTIGIDIAAVDMVYGTDGKAYVLEVNSAPGLTGTTVDNYVKELENVCDHLLGS